MGCRQNYQPIQSAGLPERLQSEEKNQQGEKLIIKRLSTLSRLPSMKNKTNEKKTGRKLLGVNITRGQHDKGFNLENEIKDLIKRISLMKKQISDYSGVARGRQMGQWPTFD